MKLGRKWQKSIIEMIWKTAYNQIIVSIKGFQRLWKRKTILAFPPWLGIKKEVRING